MFTRADLQDVVPHDNDPVGAYNILLSRPVLNRLNAVASTRHMKMKLPDLSGVVIVIMSDQEEARKCYENSLKTKRGVFMVFERPPSADTAMEVCLLYTSPSPRD